MGPASIQKVADDFAEKELYPNKLVIESKPRHIDVNDQWANYYFYELYFPFSDQLTPVETF